MFILQKHGVADNDMATQEDRVLKTWYFLISPHISAWSVLLHVIQ